MRRNAPVLLCSALLLVLSLLPSGVQAAAPKIPYWLYADLMRGESNAAGAVGVLTNIFKQGEEVVFRARVLDIATGQDPGRQGNLQAIQERGLKVTAYLEDGQSFPMSYGRYPAEGRPAAWFWTASWKIPATYKLGRVKWWVIVTDKSGASLRFDPFAAPAFVGLVVEKR